MFDDTVQPLRKRWSLGRAFLYGLLLSIAVFAINNLAQGGEEITLLVLNAPLHISVAYLASRVLWLPLVFVIVATIRNLAARKKRA